MRGEGEHYFLPDYQSCYGLKMTFKLFDILHVRHTDYLNVCPNYQSEVAMMLQHNMSSQLHSTTDKEQYIEAPPLQSYTIQ